jgi:cytochrome d ubiquinol oxidase subunit I
MEGIWETQKGAPLLLFAWPSQKEQKNTYVFGIPKLASLINTHDLDGEMQGLKSVSRKDQPMVAPVFFTFRIMIVIGLLMLTTAFTALYLRHNQRLYKAKWFHIWSIFVAPCGFVAAIAGWLTAEIGRQPWVVYNLMRTKEAVSAVSAEEVIISLILLVLAYGVTFGFYLYYLFKTMRKGFLVIGRDEVEHHAFQYMTDTSGEEI